MGLLDKLGGLFGGQSPDAQHIQAILAWVEEQGGLQVLLDKFNQGGLGEIFQSWVSSGENQSVSAEQISNVMDNQTLGSLASSLGVDQSTASDLLARTLPLLVDKLSPQGELPQAGSLLDSGLDLLKNKFFG